MFMVIPEIRLAEGRCVDCVDAPKRDDGYYESLSESPEKLARLFRRENAKSLMLSIGDMEGSKQRETVYAIISAMEIPLQLYISCSDASDIDTELIEYMFELGLKRLVLNHKVALELSQALSDIGYSESVFSRFTHPQELKEMLSDGSRTYKRIYIGRGSGIWSSDELEEIAKKAAGLRVTLWGGIEDFTDLKMAASFTGKGIDSAIIGKPLYDNSFPCQEIWRNIESSIDSSALETPISSVNKQA